MIKSPRRSSYISLLCSRWNRTIRRPTSGRKWPVCVPDALAPASSAFRPRIRSPFPPFRRRRRHRRRRRRLPARRLIRPESGSAPVRSRHRVHSSSIDNSSSIYSNIYNNSNNFSSSSSNIKLVWLLGAPRLRVAFLRRRRAIIIDFL